MLGKFVQPEYVGYYRAALGLVLSIGALISISPIVFPIFTQIKGHRLERAFAKTTKYVLILSIPAAIGIFLISKHLIQVLYGAAYSPTVIPLYILSFLIIITTLISTYNPLFQAKNKSTTLTKFIIVSLGLNIILNFILIKSFLPFGEIYATFGAGLATFISRGFLLFSISLRAEKKMKIKIPFSNFSKPIISGIFMATFLFLFNSFLNINLFLGILEVILAMVIYFSLLYVFGGIEKEDINLLKETFFPKSKI